MCAYIYVYISLSLSLSVSFGLIEKPYPTMWLIKVNTRGLDYGSSEKTGMAAPVSDPPAINILALATGGFPDVPKLKARDNKVYGVAVKECKVSYYSKETR